MKRLKIVLVCNQLQRELPALEYLKLELETVLKAKVYIIGSISEEQRILYLLNEYRPDIVFVYQIQETVTRYLAAYVRRSGGLLCVVPTEITYAKSNWFWLFNSRLTYDEYLDYYFVPGKRMLQDLKEATDINHAKLIITGSPKIDLSTNYHKNKFLNRAQFSKKKSLPSAKKNIFIYSSFFANSKEYIKKEEAFKGNIKASLRIYRSINETKKIYINDLPKLCADFPDCNIIFKPHPLESEEAYQQITSPNFFLIKSELFNDTIDSIDLAIHWNSTSATECWINGKKTIQYVPLKQYTDVLSDFYPGNPVYNNYTDLKKGIVKYLDSPIDKKFLKFQKDYLTSWYYKIDGKSSQRIARFLLKKSVNEIKTSYQPTYDKKVLILMMLEKLVGVYLSRRLMALLRPGYLWKFAIKNHINSR